MTTVNKGNSKFSLMADEWWDISGKFKPFINLICKN